MVHTGWLVNPAVYIMQSVLSYYPISFTDAVIIVILPVYQKVVYSFGFWGKFVYTLRTAGTLMMNWSLHMRGNAKQLWEGVPKLLPGRRKGNIWQFYSYQMPVISVCILIHWCPKLQSVSMFFHKSAYSFLISAQDNSHEDATVSLYNLFTLTLQSPSASLFYVLLATSEARWTPCPFASDSLQKPYYWWMLWRVKSYTWTQRRVISCLGWLGKVKCSW